MKVKGLAVACTLAAAPAGISACSSGGGGSLPGGIASSSCKLLWGDLTNLTQTFATQSAADSWASQEYADNGDTEGVALVYEFRLSVSQTVSVDNVALEGYPKLSLKKYKLAVPGDPITITNSPKAGTPDNGWTEWFLTWNQLLAGSATHQAVEAGPSGSTFVTADALAAIHVTAPLESAATGVWGNGPAT